MAFRHQSVLKRECVDALVAGRTASGLRFIDGTFGGGGHSRLLLETLPGSEVLGIDCDDMAIEAAGPLLEEFKGRLTLRKGRFSQMRLFMNELGWTGVDGILLDLGVSSPQIDTAERGFSFRMDGPLDMRMDNSAGRTAADLLNSLDEKELADLFFKYGEERKSRAVARAVVARRERWPWQRTSEFNDLLERIVGRGGQHGLPPATRCFQALRIAVNDELGELERALESSRDILNTKGRLVVISFHSLEDRLTKQFMLREAATCVCPPGLPICVCGKVKTFEIITRKPVVASDVEMETNRRASCAKMRCAERV